MHGVRASDTVVCQMKSWATILPCIVASGLRQRVSMLMVCVTSLYTRVADETQQNTGGLRSSSHVWQGFLSR